MNIRLYNEIDKTVHTFFLKIVFLIYQFFITFRIVSYVALFINFKTA